jgi:hypothetical protein
LLNWILCCQQQHTCVYHQYQINSHNQLSSFYLIHNDLLFYISQYSKYEVATREKGTIQMKIMITKIATASIVLGTLMANATADETVRTELGLLECTVEGGLGMLLGSSKKMTCEFGHSDGTIEKYTGQIDKLGLDIGVTGESFMKWVVFTPLGNAVGDYALQGVYRGVSAEASLGIGLGANALIGGSDKKIALQPLSVEGKTGLNIAVGLAALTLEPVI